MSERKSGHDRDRDRDPDPDNCNSNAVAPTTKGSALAFSSLTALETAFQKVSITSISGRAARPLMQFKSREGGLWMFGHRQTIPEPGSLWAINPATFQWGWVCWGDGNKFLGEKLVPISEPLPDRTKLPDHGFPWQQEMSVNMKCISGNDAEIEVMFVTSTQGGMGEASRLIEAVRDRLFGQHEGKVAPIVKLESTSYSHQQYGKIYVPVMTVEDWMPLDGPESAPAPAPEPPPPSPAAPAAAKTTEPTPQRRRRVV